MKQELSIEFSKKSKKEFVEDAYSGLQPGCESKGGRGCRCFRQEIQGETDGTPCKLGVRRTAEGLEYNCFRASCQLGGGFVSLGDTECRRFDSFRSSDSKFAVQTQLDEQIALPKEFTPGVSEHRRHWLSQFAIGAADIARYGIGERSGDANGVYFPIVNTPGCYSGHLRREVADGSESHDGGYVRAKWIVRALPDAVYISKAPTQGDKLVLVEDAVSAIRVGKVCKTVALLGTNIAQGQIEQVVALMTKHRLHKVYIALDPDATHKALTIQQKLRAYTPYVRVVTTASDPKDWDDNYLSEVLDISPATVSNA